MAVLPLPSLYATESAAGLAFFLSFGVGCVCVVPLSALIIVFTERGGVDGDGKAVSSGDLVQKLIQQVAQRRRQEGWRYHSCPLPRTVRPIHRQPDEKCPAVNLFGPLEVIN